MADNPVVVGRQWCLPVIANRQRQGRYWELVLVAPELAASMRPGQFVNVRCADSTDPLLRRPFSVFRMDRQAGTIHLLYEVLGTGTVLMSHWQPGCLVDVLAPLGNWFAVPPGDGPLALVAGGIGVAPLVALAEELAPSGRPLHAFVGARTQEMLLGLEELENAGATISLATDDGSAGFHGFVSELLDGYLQREGSAFDAAFVCGPRGMMEAASGVVGRAGLSCQVSMEVNMACGFGVCMGCAWRMRPRATEESSRSPRDQGAGGAASQVVYRLVCTEGPIFDAAEIIWDPRGGAHA